MKIQLNVSILVAFNKAGRGLVQHINSILPVKVQKKMSTIPDYTDAAQLEKVFQRYAKKLIADSSETIIFTRTGDDFTLEIADHTTIEAIEKAGDVANAVGTGIMMMWPLYKTSISPAIEKLTTVMQMFGTTSAIKKATERRETMKKFREDAAAYDEKEARERHAHNMKIRIEGATAAQLSTNVLDSEDPHLDADRCYELNAFGYKTARYLPQEQFKKLYPKVKDSVKPEGTKIDLRLAEDDLDIKDAGDENISAARALELQQKGYITMRTITKEEHNALVPHGTDVVVIQ